MPLLGRRGLTSVLLEGGGGGGGPQAIAAGVVDKIMFFYAPKLLAGNDGVPICRGPGATTMAAALAVQDLEIERLGSDILVSGYLKPGDHLDESYVHRNH